MESKLFSRSIFKDIRFWIFLFAILRFYGITNPPLEVAHNWRQSTVCMAARNFYEIDADIFHPRIDFAEEKTGITGMEFPILNYLIYILSLIFGYDHWYGRLINLVVSSVGVFYFYKLIRKYFNPEIAFNAGIILLVSFWLSYSRKIMPDTFATSLVLMSIYYGTNYLDKKASLQNILLYVLFGSLGVLSKLPVGYIWIVFAILIVKQGIKLSSKVKFVIASIIIFLPVFYWYFIWVPHLVEEYGFWHFFMGKSLQTGFSETMTYLPRVLNHFYETAIRYVALIFLLIGLVFGFIKKQKLLLAIFFLSLLTFTTIILKSGKTFAFHSYYIIPFIPVMALIAANGLQQIRNKKLIIIFLILIGIEGVLNQWNDFYIKPNNKALLTLEEEFNKISSPEDLIVINSGDYPTPMYFTHRKGWITYNKNLTDSTYMAEIKNKGCKYALILKKSFGNNMDLEEEVILENEHYKIYKIQ